MKHFSLSLKVLCTFVLLLSCLFAAYAEDEGGIPTWDVLWINVHSVQCDGKESIMTEEECSVSKEMSERFEAFVEENARHTVDIQIHYEDLQTPVTSITDVDGNAWIGPDDMHPFLEDYFSKREYDSIIVLSTLDGFYRDDYWGITEWPSAASMGVGFTSVPFYEIPVDEYMRVTDDNPHPEEIYTHEWLHQLECFYMKLGYAFPEIDPCVDRLKEQGGTVFYEFYGDVISGDVYDEASGQNIGMTAEMWKTKPTNILKEITDLEFNGHTYQLIPMEMTWEDAKLYCESQGGHLAALTSYEESNAVYSYIRKYGVMDCWFGLYDSVGDNNGWAWVTGEAFSFSNWAEGEPTDWEEPYGMFYSDFDKGEWNNGSDGEFYFVCEWEK